MAEERLKDESAQITEYIQQGHNFLLSGGAGSGKTYTLVEVVRWIIENYPSSLVACITYTNAAVKEIAQRVNHENLRVSTIHDFLWDNIKNYQKISFVNSKINLIGYLFQNIKNYQKILFVNLNI